MSLLTFLLMKDDFLAFREVTVVLCGDIGTEMIEHEICLLTSALGYTVTPDCEMYTGVL